MARDLQVNILAPSEKFEAGVKKMESSARSLHAAELRLIASEERLEKLRTTGKASAGQLASAQASVISAQDKVAAAHGRTANVTEQASKRTSRAVGAVGTAFTSMKGAAVLGAAGVGVAMVAMARDSIRAASELNEQISATKTVFKDASSEILTFADDVAGSLGISERAALQAANGFGDLFTKLGFTSTAAATFSEDLVRISADFASFKDLNPDDVLEKLHSGLAGESEPLRSLGVFLTEAKVAAEGMRLGLADASGELDDGARVAARYSLIIQGMGEAQGDVARTSDSYANAQRRFAAASEDLKAELGQGLLPILADIATIGTKVAKSLGSAGDAAEDANQSLAGRTEDWVSYLDFWNYIPGLLDKAAGSSDGAAEATDELADSQAALSDKQSRVRRNVEDSTKALEEQAEALDRLLQATVAQFDAELSHQQAIMALADELDSYNEALARNSDGIADNDATARELTQAQVGLQDQLLQTAAAAVQQAEDQAAAAGRTLTESQKYDLFREALLSLKEQFPQLGEQVDGYVARLKEVPATVSTSVRVLGVADAESAMMRVEKAIRGVTNIGGVTVTIPPIRARDAVGDGPGRGGPVAARVRAMLEPGTHITSTYRTPAQNRAAGGSPSSYHLDRGNPAVDVGGSRAALDRLAAKARRVGGWRELLWQVPGHYDHVHFAANGGVHENHTAQIAPAGAWRVWAEDETGGEAYIPLAASKRPRSMDIWRETGRRLGVQLSGLAGGGVGGGDTRTNALRGGYTLTQAVVGLTNPEDVRALVKVWGDYNDELERAARLKELLKDEADARAEMAAAKTTDERARAQESLNRAMQATTDFVLSGRRDDELAAVERLIDGLEAEAEAREKVAAAARAAAEWATDLAESTQAAQDRALQDLNRMLDQERDLRARSADLVRQHAKAVSDVQARQVQAEADYYTRRAALGQRFNAEQQRILDARRDALVAWAPLDQVASPSWGNTVEQLVGNAADQLRQFEQWMAELERARGRGVSEQVIASLGLDEGPQALGQLQQFNQATLGQIEELNAAVARRSELAGQQTSLEQQKQYGELGQALVELRSGYVEDLRGLEEDYRASQQDLLEQLAELNAQLLVDQDQVAQDLAAIGAEQGRAYGDALAQALNSKLPAVQAAAAALQSAAASATAAAEQAVKLGSAPGAPGKAAPGAPPLGTAGSFTLNGQQVHVNTAGIIDSPGAYYGKYPAQVVRTATFDSGGWLEPGFTLAYNGTGQRERVITAAQQSPATGLTININGPVFGVDHLQAQIRTGAESALAQLRGAALAHGGH